MNLVRRIVTVLALALSLVLITTAGSESAWSSALHLSVVKE